MEPSRDELREHLVAALNAAPELPGEDRQYLADSFLDRLEAGYQLVPRGQTASARPHLQPSVEPVLQTARTWLPILAGIVLALVLLPTLAWLFFAPFTWHTHHAFGVLPFLMFFLILRFAAPWRRRRWGRVYHF